MMETFPIILGGVKKQTEEIVSVRFPYTGEVYAQVCQASTLDLKAAVTESVKGFETTKKLSSGTRAQILTRLAMRFTSGLTNLLKCW